MPSGHPDVPWAGPGSDLTAVMLGQGGTLWGSADATPPDSQGWQHIPVDPKVVAVRVAGLSYGLILFDDTGSEWTRDGDRFQQRMFPNRFVYSRHAGPQRAPYLTVSLGPADHAPPEAPTGLRGDASALPAGQTRVEWITPADHGPAGTVGFFVEMDGKPIPRYDIPPAGPPGERVIMHLRGLPAQKPEVAVTVRAVDAVGNVGPPVSAVVPVSTHRPEPLLGNAAEPFAEAGPLPRLAEAEVAVIDALDKVHPLSGRMIPEQKPAYLAANHLFSARKNLIRLSAARNEFVDFQLLLHGRIRGLEECSLIVPTSAGSLHGEFREYRYVASGQGPLPDPLGPPLAAPFVLGAAGTDYTWRSLHGELYVPHDSPAGTHRGKLVLRTKAAAAGSPARLEIDVLLHVWDFTLPDFLSFLPEMNCYGLPDDKAPVYRMGHRHRTVVNCVPYNQAGRVADDWTLPCSGERLDWRRWDARLGPFLDGSAFADLPRRGVPLECFYLPLCENWPSPMEGNYNGDYWADRAFPPRYRQRFVEATRQIAEHAQARGWRDTIFEGFLNNKNNFKQQGWSRGSSPWLLDEPANFQDYWALRFFGEAFHEGVRQALGGLKKGMVPGTTQANPRETRQSLAGDGPLLEAIPRFLFRCDISRPQWQRDSLDGVLNYNVVGNGPFRQYHDLVIARKEKFQQIVLDYGTTNAVEESNVQPVAWCLDSWTLGSDGVVPWQTIGTAESWVKADALAVFYPPGAAGFPWCPSIRLKAYCRGQQDAEYLALLAYAQSKPRWEVGQAVRAALGLVAERRGTGFQGEDAGSVHYAKIKPQDLWALRIRVARTLSALHPAAQRAYVRLPYGLAGSGR